MDNIERQRKIEELKNEIEEKKRAIAKLEKEKSLEALNLPWLEKGVCIKIDNQRGYPYEDTWVKVDWSKYNTDTNCLEIKGKSITKSFTRMYYTIRFEIGYSLFNVTKDCIVTRISDEEWNSLVNQLTTEITESLC